MIPIVQAISILSEIETEGHSPLKIQCDDGNVYIVKKRKHFNIDTTITSEFICNYLCKIWNILTPDSALVNVPIELINDLDSRNHKPIFYKDYTCFGSKFMDNAIDIEISDLTSSSKNLKLYENPVDFLKIGLFDLWLVNIDRKPTNLNLMKVINTNFKFEFMAIDNAYTFDDLRYDQIFPSAELSSNDSLLFLDFAKFIYNNKLRALDIDYELNTYCNKCIQDSEENLSAFLEFLALYYKEESKYFQHLIRFIFNKERNGTIFADFLSRIK